MFASLQRIDNRLSPTEVVSRCAIALPVVTPPTASAAPELTPANAQSFTGAEASYVWMWHHEPEGWVMRRSVGAEVPHRQKEGDLIAYNNDTPDGTPNTHKTQSTRDPEGN